ncbi:MAG: cytochrome P450 [Pseudomonadales bacterium]|nr:cytochrome P450 [Pseudomonadales bacterium]
MTEKCPFQADLMNPVKMAEQGLAFDAFRKLRAECPVSLQDSDRGPFWAVTKREHIDFISKNPALFSSSDNLAHPTPGGDEDPEAREIMKQLIINMDPPDHIKFRRVVKNAFTGRAVDELEPMMRDFAKDIIDQIAKKGECEFVSEVAAEMPLFVICALMEMPSEDRQKFSDLVDIMIGMDDPELDVSPEDGQLAAAQLFEIAMGLAANHRANPKEGTVLHALLNGVVEGDNLNEFEFCSFFLILIAGGVETTRTATTHGMRLLMEHPEQLQMLVDNPALIPDAVEEILRFYPSFNYMQRTAREDIKLGDMDIKKGDIVRMFYPSVNHDDEIFGEDAEKFDITRNQRTPNLRNEHRTFGIGQHFCLGSHLARKELNVMFSEIIPRLRNPKLVGQTKNLVSSFIPGIKEMHISFDPE